MKEPLKSFSEIIAQANDLFCEKNKSIDTVIGIIDQAFRKQGMNSDAISIDCIPLNKKIVFLLHDEKPKLVEIAFGNKAGDINSTSQQLIEEVTVRKVVEYMLEYFQ